MNARRTLLWVIVIGSALLVLIPVADAVGGNLVSKLLSFSRFLSMYWFLGIFVFFTFMIFIASFLVITDTSREMWKKALWVISFVLFGPVTIPLYGAVSLHALSEGRRAGH